MTVRQCARIAFRTKVYVYYLISTRGAILFYSATSDIDNQSGHELSTVICQEFRGTLLLRSSPKVGEIKGKQSQP